MIAKVFNSHHFSPTFMDLRINAKVHAWHRPIQSYHMYIDYDRKS